MSLPDDPPPLPPPRRPRDPLLDDPVFAEIVSAEPATPAEPIYAEPVEAPAEVELPIARPAARAKAMPVRSPRPLSIPSTMPPPPIGSDPPKGQWFAACGVIGCLGILVLASIVLLAWIAITLLSEFGHKIGEKKPDPIATQSGSRPGPIAPTVLVNDIKLPLEGAVDAVGHGGGGRFLLLRIPRLQQLHVFDANEAQVVQKIPLAEKNALFAAGASKAFAYYPASGKLERFDLGTGASEFQFTRPSPVTLVDAMAIGPGSDGPLYLIATSPGSPAKIQTLDTVTFQTLASHEVKGWLGRNDREVYARASFDGSVLGVAGANGALAIRFDEGKPRAIPLSPKAGLAVPSPDGQFVYTSRGVYDSNGKLRSGTERNFFTFPTTHGSGLFLSLEVDEGKVTGFPKLHAAGSSSTSELVALDKGEVFGALPANVLDGQTIPTDERVHLWPDAGLLAFLPVESNQLLLFKIDVPMQLKEAGKEFLAFASDPATIARRGSEWSYAPRFWSKSGLKPKLTLEDPIPKGMKLANGKLTWTPLPGGVDSVELELEATDAETSLKATRKFRVRIVE